MACRDTAYWYRTQDAADWIMQCVVNPLGDFSLSFRSFSLLPCAMPTNSAMAVLLASLLLAQMRSLSVWVRVHGLDLFCCQHSHPPPYPGYRALSGIPAHFFLRGEHQSSNPLSLSLHMDRKESISQSPKEHTDWVKSEKQHRPTIEQRELEFHPMVFAV